MVQNRQKNYNGNKISRYTIMASACKDLSKRAIEAIGTVNWVVPPSALVTSDDRPSFGVTTQLTA